MCPNKKLKWFKEHRWEPDAIEEVWQFVICCWAESYKPAVAATNTAGAVLKTIPVKVSHLLMIGGSDLNDEIPTQPGAWWEASSKVIFYIPS